MKDKKGKIFFGLFIGLSGLALLSFILIISLFSTATIKNFLININFYFLELNFLLLCIGFIILFIAVKPVLLSLSRNEKLFLALIPVTALILTTLVAPKTHRLFYDEDIYQNIGQNFSELHKAQMCLDGRTEYDEYRCYSGEYNKQPYGYPYLLSLGYRLFGIDENISFMMNNLFFVLSIFIVFFISFFLFNKTKIALISALIFALLPQNILWSNTAAAEPSTALFAGVAVLAAIIFVKKDNTLSLIFYIASASFAVQFRPESVLILPVSFLYILFKKPGIVKEKRFFYALLLFFLISYNQWLHLWAVKGSNWGSSANKFGFDYLLYNLKTNTFFYFENTRFPVLFTVIFIFGFFYKGFTKEKIVAFFWFFLFWCIFLFFYAGSYNYGVDVRYSLLSYIPLAIIAGIGIEKIRSLIPNLNLHYYKIVVIILVIHFLTFLPLIRSVTQESWGARADHKYAKEFANLLPENSIVLTHNPNLFQVWGKAAAQTSFATERKYYVEYVLFTQYKGGVYFHYNYWCNVPDSVQNSFCENILAQYDTEKIKSFTEQNFEYILYKLSLKSNTD